MINFNKYYSLYIHIPWCLKKCPYCDFYSTIFIKKNKQVQEQYINSLLLDLKKTLFLIKRTIYIKSIFLGGGTPSLLNKKLISLLLNKIKKNVNVLKTAEITIEINPSSISEKKIRSYIDSGINRFSIGIQSFNNKSLKILGRIHNSEEAINAINILIQNNISNFNLDIIYGIPGQSLKNSYDDLYKAILFQPSHISWYQLTIEKNTIFEKIKPKNLLNDDLLWKMFLQGKKMLFKHKYFQYEISSFVRKEEFVCKHNLNYWYFGNYLGIGCNSHSKITLLNKKIIRIIKNKNIKQYINGYYFYSTKKILDKEIIFEFFLNRFRLYKKINKKEFFKITGIKITKILPLIKKALKLNYLKENNNYWFITNKGHLYLNDLLEIFI
ncbi:radical SAM family heme chaperone HemW [Enterobacteriaceae endosymbiont of Donacia bicoloricornis]|uniref:radical SAM family heme chaperone HemW n=1 Tax=Enterobacteriaceae endosymbiont of Donacia bicoloricornis TaxID=2675772 RepID=UPI0014497F97|nr:radical SAM family heme chaperone HemW [Enterobacteriaceae endosymbiont of Donacia bicoloricornis]QJC37800.1 radical SAM family heme chaperone HemW [Enterobacteriaceae endosymbiont of Donacia bicoloricornis]